MIYILLPAYNEADNIYQLLLQIDATVRELDPPNDNSKPTCQIVIVNDGSTDTTTEEINRYKGNVPIFTLNHETNHGLGMALFSGITHILTLAEDKDKMITFDADGTHDPKYMISIDQKLEQGFDIVVASRYAKGGKEYGVSFLRKCLSHGARRFYRLFLHQWPLNDFSCGYRGIRIPLLRTTVEHWREKLFELPGFTCTGELMMKMFQHTTPDKVAEIPFELHYEKKGGESKMPALKTIMGTFRLLLRSRQWLR